MSSRKSAAGVTLLEVMLVLAIGAMITVMGIQFYRNKQTDVQVAQLQYNVDQLFLAAQQYYVANCNGHYDTSNNFVAGTLNPANGSLASLTTPFPLASIVTSLVTPGFLTGWSSYNPLLDTAAQDGGYLVQFNPVVTNSGNANTPYVLCQGTNCQTTLPPNLVNSTHQAAVLLWRIQIAVKMLNPAQAATYAAIMGADCVSGINGTYVNLCNPTPTADGYLVWERAPSAISARELSTLSSSMFMLKEFNMQYTHDQMYEITGGYQAADVIPKYYLCGG